MKKQLRFHLVLHDHQPFGNFPEVFEQAYEQAYGPTIEALARHPGVLFSLHLSGALWEWVEAQRPRAMELIAQLVERGQLELIGGPFYEPVLALISRRDALGQIETMRRWLEQRFGVSPEGAWLAERVWQPDLPETFQDAGVRFAFVDDTHLYTAGPEEDDPADYVFAESRGARVALFPIDRKLRYAIPFQSPEHTLDRLRELADAGAESVTYADDGEKLGLWPGTADWVWNKGWFERFLGALEEAQGVVTTHPSETLRSTPGRGLAYPPTTSYEELGEWSLPPGRAIQRKQLFDRLESAGLLDQARPLLRGGHFTVFLARYPEINLLHKRMLAVSDALADGEETLGKQLPDARQALYRSQVNCPYWHGLFGGLYMPVLRHVIPVELQRAERLIAQALGQPPSTRHDDLDGDGYPEFLGGPGPGRYLLSERLCAGLRAWSRWDLDDAPLDVVARRKEAYHLQSEGSQDPAEPSGDSPVSIHDAASVIPAEMLERAGWDREPRVSGVALFVPSDLDPVALRSGGSWREEQFAPWAIEAIDPRTLRANPLEDPGAAERTIRFSPDATGASFRHEVRDLPEGQRLAVEWNVALPGPGSIEADGEVLARYDGARTGTIQAGPVREVMIHRSETGARLHFRSETPFELSGYTLETILRSESGFESVIQGVCLCLAPPEGSRSFLLEVSMGRPDA